MYKTEVRFHLCFVTVKTAFSNMTWNLIHWWACLFVRFCECVYLECYFTTVGCCLLRKGDVSWCKATGVTVTVKGAGAGVSQEYFCLLWTIFAKYENWGFHDSDHSVCGLVDCDTGHWHLSITNVFEEYTAFMVCRKGSSMFPETLLITCKTTWCHNLEQWFATSVPQHTGVPVHGIRSVISI